MPLQCVTCHYDQCILNNNGNNISYSGQLYCQHKGTDVLICWYTVTELLLLLLMIIHGDDDDDLCVCVV